MNYNWSITGLKAIPTLDGKSNVISAVYFNVSGEESGIRVNHSGVISIPTDNIETFIPYENLKPETVLEWVKFYLGSKGIGEIESDIANQLRLQIDYASSQLQSGGSSSQISVLVNIPW
jgi:hypothetical protein